MVVLPHSKGGCKSIISRWLLKQPRKLKRRIKGKCEFYYYPVPEKMHSHLWGQNSFPIWHQIHTVFICLNGIRDLLFSKDMEKPSLGPSLKQRFPLSTWCKVHLTSINVYKLSIICTGGHSVSSAQGSTQHHLHRGALSIICTGRHSASFSHRMN